MYSVAQQKILQLSVWMHVVTQSGSERFDDCALCMSDVVIIAVGPGALILFAAPLLGIFCHALALDGFNPVEQRGFSIGKGCTPSHVLGPCLRPVCLHVVPQSACERFYDCA